MLRDIVSSVFLLGGALFCLVGAFGLLRFPDLLSRLQAATKPQTIGLIMVLIGVGLQLRFVDAVGLVLVALLQVITAPVLSQLVGRAAYRTGIIEKSMLVHDHLGDRLRREGLEPPKRETPRDR
ncbi:monovalent cation/H(+) antiporter subunit G [Saccharomonospora viridis]|jgi:multicomponent Na+:H+ antiporter subunit G|uniref:Monovalent cation/proton antiporter, MnhG/PhaG subunit n=1 Tax=Saccharomonospora viridis (strain ATCC 15386 / DSM 43017 / JCM 3036 / CCUG 5913 / NBRC 12207 / NCIMB 9602 / P101) TaxID=471857 RepID=C7MQX4_SACVD|nr:monovalent cation/H(+) antiporter subunit G [Saccharomonospora viridis]ACU96520.1 monovalent cation/proton antiporter, MnhG/PhaG subunit [Saccharomonospora viridis DSM 43017]